MELTTRYIQNSLKLESAQMLRIKECAAKHKIVVILGFSENVNDSLYISQAIIDADGEIRVTRKKVKATHMERTIFVDSFGDCLDSVADTAAGRIGALSCWEHIQPLLKYHTYSQREQIHVAAWPPLFGDEDGKGLYSLSRSGRTHSSMTLGSSKKLIKLLGTTAVAQTYAFETQSFVLHTTALISQPGIDLMKSQGGLMGIPGGGCSAIFGPEGRKLTVDIPDTEERMLYHDLDLSEVLKSRAFVDVCGHYSRPDMLWLGVDNEVKRHVINR
jgi:predicted amidohydrolase